MFSSKTLVAACVVLGSILLGSVANADWMTPSGIAATSATEGGNANAGLCIDGSLATYTKFMCDDGVNADTSNDIITGYVLYDLGSVQQVGGFELWSRNHTAAMNPKDVTFFYVTNDNLANFSAANYTTEAQVAASPYITLAASKSLPALTSNASYQVNFASTEQFTAQYAGVLMLTGYDTPSGKANNLAEVQFNTTAPIPEPSTIVLAAMGLIGLLCYAWRKQK